jgi:hypothetical protein
MTTRAPLLILPLLLAVPGDAATALAQARPPATGTFTSRGAGFTVAGAVAFTGTSSLDGETPVLVVAISNTGLNAEAIGDFVDRRRAIERLVRDDQTPIVYLEFTPQGRWRGLSYYFASGNGCAFCTSDVASTVALAHGRLTGTLKGTEEDRPFDVALDVPVLGDDHGTALPPDGGEPGKAYLAYHAALAKGDAAAIEPLLSPGNREVFAGAMKNDDVAGYISYLTEKHRVETVRVTKGWASPAKASLLVAGESPLGKVAGEVFLVNTKGVWGVDEELIDLVIGQ